MIHSRCRDGQSREEREQGASGIDGHRGLPLGHRRLVVIGAIALLLVAAGSCTASQLPYPAVPGVEQVPGFWRGLWHGFIAPIAFVVSLISEEVRIYAAPNAGRWYDFGFMLGIHGFSGGLFAGSRSRPVERR